MKNRIQKIIASVSLVMLFQTVVLAQEGADVDPGFYANLAGWLVGVVGVVVIAGAIWMLVNLLTQIIKVRELELYSKEGLEEYLAAKKANEVSWWKRFSKQMTSAVPVDKENDIMLDHEYDGIRELDNSLPPWWLYGFYLSIAVSVFYVGFYHFSSYAKSTTELYEIEMEQSQAAIDRYLAKQANKIDESNVTTLTDAADLASGKTIFELNCVACHLAHGGGSEISVGPNLTDEYWIHGGGIKNVFKTVKYGVPEKGMIAWSAQLRPVEIHQVSSYILSLQGTKPEGAKEAQGELWAGDEEEKISEDVGGN